MAGMSTTGSSESSEAMLAELKRKEEHKVTTVAMYHTKYHVQTCMNHWMNFF